MAVLGDRQRLLGDRQLVDRVDHPLDPAQLDLWSVHHPAGQGDRRPDREPVDPLVELGPGLAPVGELDGPSLVAKDHELHTPLQSEGLHPAADPHLVPHPQRQLAKKYPVRALPAFLAHRSPLEERAGPLDGGIQTRYRSTAVRSLGTSLHSVFQMRP